jgi:ribose 1,5-bisphosphokinase
MAGGFVLVVGPSGSGKDSLINQARTAFAHDARIIFPRRVVTRRSSGHEIHDSMSEAEFSRAEAAGRFALSWRAHGLGYAVPVAVLHEVDRGCVAVCNVSRGVVDWARQHLPNVATVEITAPPAVLAARLINRGRADDGDLDARLARALEITAHADLTIMNDRSVEEGGLELVAFIARHAGAVRGGAPAHAELEKG